MHIHHNTEIRHRVTITFSDGEQPVLHRPGNGAVRIDQITFGKVGTGTACLTDLVNWTGHTIYPDGHASTNVRTGGCSVTDFDDANQGEFIRRQHALWRKRKSNLSALAAAEATRMMTEERAS